MFGGKKSVPAPGIEVAKHRERGQGHEARTLHISMKSVFFPVVMRNIGRLE